jgi:hypothetical protein
MYEGAAAICGGGGGGGGSLLQAATSDAVANARMSFFSMKHFPQSVGRAAVQNGKEPSWFRLVTKIRLIWLY